MPKSHTGAVRGLEDIVSELTGPAIGQIIRCLTIAEEEIARAKAKYPSKAERLNMAFLLLKPTEPLKGRAERVYRVHVRELLIRAMRGHDTRPGTAAEVLCALMGAATIAPLNAEGAALAERLFRIVMRREIGGPSFRPVWKGQVEEAFAVARQKTRAPWRR